MLRKLLIVGAVLLVAVIGFRAVRHSELGGYVCSQWSKSWKSVRNQVPTAVELDRLDYEIAQLERDIQKQARPLAELKFDVKQLSQDITQTTASLEGNKKVLASLTSTFDKGHVAAVNESQLKHKITETFARCKLYQGKLDTQQKLLSAKQKQFDAMFEQVNKMSTQKRAFEIELANLRANEELLKLGKIESLPAQDNSRFNRIKEGLRNIQKKQAIDKMEQDFQSNAPFQTDPAVTPTDNTPEVNLEEIRSYLQGVTTEQKKVDTVNSGTN